MKLKIQVGNTSKTIIAGIAEHYDSRDLIGKQIVIDSYSFQELLKELEKRLFVYEATSRFATNKLRKRISILEANTGSAVNLQQILTNDTGR